MRKDADGGSFTVRRVTFNVGVERSFMFVSPLIEKVEVLRHGKVRRANLYYLRGISEKASRLKENRRPEVEAVAAVTPVEQVLESPKSTDQQPEPETK